MQWLLKRDFQAGYNRKRIQRVMRLHCCDREAIAFVATPYSTSGAEVRRRIRKSVYARLSDAKLEPSVQWLSDNESICTSLESVIEAERHHRVPITTSAVRVIEQVPGWIEDYNTFAPRSALGMMTPAEFRREQQPIADTGCLTK